MLNMILLDLTSYSQRKKPLSSYVLLGANKTDRDARMALTFTEGSYTQTVVASAFGVSSSTVSRVIKDME